MGSVGPGRLGDPGRSCRGGALKGPLDWQGCRIWSAVAWVRPPGPKMTFSAFSYSSSAPRRRAPWPGPWARGQSADHATQGELDLLGGRGAAVPAATRSISESKHLVACARAGPRWPRWRCRALALLCEEAVHGACARAERRRSGRPAGLRVRPSSPDSRVIRSTPGRSAMAGSKSWVRARSSTVSRAVMPSRRRCRVSASSRRSPPEQPMMTSASAMAPWIFSPPRARAQPPRSATKASRAARRGVHAHVHGSPVGQLGQRGPGVGTGADQRMLASCQKRWAPTTEVPAQHAGGQVQGHGDDRAAGRAQGGMGAHVLGGAGGGLEELGQGSGGGAGLPGGTEGASGPGRRSPARPTTADFSPSADLEQVPHRGVAGEGAEGGGHGVLGQSRSAGHGLQELLAGLLHRPLVRGLGVDLHPVAGGQDDRAVGGRGGDG